MRPHIVLIALLISSPAMAADEQQSASPSPYAELNKQVQEILRAESFYSGPINGDFGYYTQAALAQFQLSRALPASGSLDDTTLAAMGLERHAERPAEAGADTVAVDQGGAATDASEQSASGASAPAR